MGVPGEIRLTVILDGKTGVVKVEAPLNALNRFACISLLECGKHEINKHYDEAESLIQKPEFHVPQFGRQ